MTLQPARRPKTSRLSKVQKSTSSGKEIPNRACRQKTQPVVATSMLDEFCRDIDKIDFQIPVQSLQQAVIIPSEGMRHFNNKKILIPHQKKAVNRGIAVRLKIYLAGMKYKIKQVGDCPANHNHQKGILGMKKYCLILRITAGNGTDDYNTCQQSKHYV